jgi:hypothetical protein
VPFEQTLSSRGDSGRMDELLDIDVDALLQEIARYLAAVDAFRAAACEPTWLPEPAASTSAGTPAPRGRGGARRARA